MAEHHARDKRTPLAAYGTHARPRALPPRPDSPAETPRPAADSCGLRRGGSRNPGAVAPPRPFVTRPVSEPQPRRDQCTRRRRVDSRPRGLDLSARRTREPHLRTVGVGTLRRVAHNLGYELPAVELLELQGLGGQVAPEQRAKRHPRCQTHGDGRNPPAFPKPEGTHSARGGHGQPYQGARSAVPHERLGARHSDPRSRGHPSQRRNRGPHRAAAANGHERGPSAARSVWDRCPRPSPDPLLR